MTAKEHVEQLATILQGPKEYIPDGDNQKIPLNALWHISNLEKQGMIQTVNDKTFIHLQPENEVYRIGVAEPMTQDEFVEYTKGLKKPEKPSGFLSGFREWFHKHVHPLKDFAKYDTQMKKYEMEKYNYCKDAGLDVSGKIEVVEAAKKQIQKNCGLADVDQLLDAFEAAVRADPEVGKCLLEALPKQNLSTCTDLQWDMAQSGVTFEGDLKKTSDRDMHIGKELSLMQACKRFLPPELQEKVDAKYAEAQEPYKKMNELMRGTTLSPEEKSKLYRDWQSGEFEKTYWANKNAPKVEEPAEKKLNEMSNEARVAEIMQRREDMDNSVVEETAEKFGVDKETVQQAFDTVKAENNVATNESEVFVPDQPQVNNLVNEQPQMGNFG